MEAEQFPAGWWIGIALLVSAVGWTFLGLVVLLFCRVL